MSIAFGPRKNNIFHFLLNGAPEVVVVPEGYYSISELLAIVKTGIELIFCFIWYSTIAIIN